MLKRSIIQLSFIFAFCSFASSNSEFLFTCLAQKDYKCLFDEIDLNQDWQIETNAQGQTPLLFAIDARDPDLVMYLVNKGARVETSHIILALKKFFASELHDNSKNSFEESAEVKSLLLGALNGVREKTPKQLSNILNMIISKKKIADDLLEMYENRLITKRDVNIFLREYYCLFIAYDKHNEDIMNYVVNSFMGLNVEKFLLLMICDVYKISKKRVENEIFIISDKFNIGSNEEKLAYAIIEKSRKFFDEFKVEGFLNEAKNYKQKGYLFEAIKSFEELSKFVMLTIKYSDRQSIIDRNYRTWINIYRVVIDGGDFNSAFFMAKALNDDSVGSIVSKEIYRTISLINPENNYKNYRDQIRLFNGRFCLPYVVVLIDKIMKISAKEIMCKNSGYELLDKKTLKKFNRLRSDISKYINSARTRCYQSSPAFHKLVEHVIVDAESQEFKKAYNLIWRRQKNTRSISMKLDKKAISLEIPRKIITPREKKTVEWTN